jgi:hypothetical protein
MHRETDRPPLAADTACTTAICASKSSTSVISLGPSITVRLARPLKSNEQFASPGRYRQNRARRMSQHALRGTSAQRIKKALMAM